MRSVAESLFDSPGRLVCERVCVWGSAPRLLLSIILLFFLLKQIQRIVLSPQNLQIRKRERSRSLCSLAAGYSHTPTLVLIAREPARIVCTGERARSHLHHCFLVLLTLSLLLLEHALSHFSLALDFFFLLKENLFLPNHYTS